MGVNDRVQDAKDDKRRAAQAKKKVFGRGSAGGHIADWGSVDGAVLSRAVAAIGKSGGALRLGYTRDGGAYAIGIYDGDDKQTVYVPPSESVEAVLEEIIEHYDPR